MPGYVRAFRPSAGSPTGGVARAALVRSGYPPAVESEAASCLCPGWVVGALPRANAAVTQVQLGHMTIPEVQFGHGAELMRQGLQYQILVLCLHHRHR